jgi:poly-beta-1,6-N-acetyl-D-glucosamine synthase
MLWIYLISLALAIGYAVLMGQYGRAWRAIRMETPDPDFVPKTTISVVIAARNEDFWIEHCLQSIANCIYPADLLEVIVVNDGSTDQTAVRALGAKRHFNAPEKLQLLHTTPDKSGKKNALTMAIRQASGELIVCTDADCQVGRLWLHLITQLYERERPGIITAPVALHVGRSVLDQFQALDLMGLMGVTAAGSHLNWHHMANGANMAFPKALFETIGGYRKNDYRASGDDMFFVQQAAARGERVVFLKNNYATALTDAPASWGAFFQQRLRWGTKNTDLPEWKVKASLGVVFLTCWAIVLTAALGLMGYWMALVCCAVLLASKLVSDWVFLSMMSRFFGGTDLMRCYLRSSAIHLIYIVVLGTASLLPLKYEWKGRKVR